MIGYGVLVLLAFVLLAGATGRTTLSDTDAPGWRPCWVPPSPRDGFRWRVTRMTKIAGPSGNQGIHVHVERILDGSVWVGFGSNE